MKRDISIIPALILWLCAAIPPVAAGERQLTWEDLLPQTEVVKDPYAVLSDEQFLVFTEVMFVREQLDQGVAVDEQTRAAYDAQVAELGKQGVDVDKLIAQIAMIERKRNDKTLLTNPQLDGTKVRMPGYMLPLEFDDTRITEFLLVPYFGACIHYPPPPSNQIVHVKLDKGFEFPGGVYAPVFVNGRMQVVGTANKLNLVDGSNVIFSSYTIAADSVEAYRQ